MSQNYVYPSSSDVTVTGIGTPNNAPIPGESVLVAGENPSGDQQVLQTDAGGNLKVALASSTVSPLPTSDAADGTVGLAIPAKAIAIGARNAGGNLENLLVDGSNFLEVNIAAQSASQLNTNIAAFGNTTVAIGQHPSAGSLPVVLASDQSSVPVTVGNFPATQPISGTVSVNNFPATQAVTQSTTPWVDNISQFGGASVSLGQKVSASSMPVVIASDDTVAISAASLPLPTGAATSANQSTIITDLGTIAANQTNGTQLTGLSAGSNIIGSVHIISTEGTLTDNSGTTSGTPNTSTQIMAANSSRKYLLIENLSSTDNIYINFTSSATSGPGSYVLFPGGSLTQETGFVSGEAVNVLATVASVPYTAKQA